MTALVGMPASPAAHAAVAPTAAVAPGAPTFEHLQPIGVSDLAALGRARTASARVAGQAVGPETAGEEADHGAARAAVGALAVPDPAPTAVTTATPQAQGFDGLDVADERNADQGDQVTFEAPDQGLCAKNGVVLEMVNRAALAVYSDVGTVLVPPVAMNAFFGLPPIIDRQVNPPTFGPVMTDPQCYYDSQVERWFLTIADVAANPTTGEFEQDTAIAVAVSQTSDPTSTWALYRLDTTNDGRAGTPAHPDCPCVGDQPVVGADANGFYISTNEFSLDPSAPIHDAQVYAVSKRLLAAAAMIGTQPPTVAHIDAGHVAGLPAFSVHPATTPPGGAFAENTEYFLSTIPGYIAARPRSSDDRLVVWALKHTERLVTPQPAVLLTRTPIGSEPYVLPPNVEQRPGSHPLGESVGEPLNALRSGDTRMQQVQFTSGRLFGAVNTAVAGGRVGIAWFIVQPQPEPGGVSGQVDRQGYVAVERDSLIYPAVGVTASGQGVIAMGLAGPDSYPSATYVDIDLTGVHGKVREIAVGTGPEDGLFCYQAFIGPSAQYGCPWGDYSGAVAENATTIITGVEYIPPRPRAQYADWGTFISRVHA
ncbi:MAG: hypothetical protein ABR511_00370 [Acidimicrobiales bacterium]